MNSRSIDQIRAFYEATRHQLYTYAVSLTHNQELAEDAIHTAFAGILKRDRTPEDLRPYMFRSVRNAALDALKASSNGHTPAPILEQAHTPDPALPILIEEALAQLSDDQREAIVLKIYSGLTLKEIAETHQVSINTSASHYRRGLQKLRTIIEEVPHERD